MAFFGRHHTLISQWSNRSWGCYQSCMSSSCWLDWIFILIFILPCNSSTTAQIPPETFGGTVKVEFMHSFSPSNQSFLLTKDNSTMFTHNAPLAPSSGIWGELIPFSPLNACEPLQLSNYTRKVGSHIQFSTVGPYPHVIALVARGNCTFEEKFDLVDNVPNVIGMIMYDYPDGDNLSNDIEISTFRMTSIPGFLIDYKTGQELLQKANQMRSQNKQGSSDPLWIKVTLQYNAYTGPIESILQFALLFVMALLGVAFAASVYMHYHIYRLQQQLGEHRITEARNAIVINEAFMEKLAIRKFYKPCKVMEGGDAGGGVGVGVSEITKVTGASLTNPESIAVVEAEELLIHPHAPPNDTCPICLDEFALEESLNELPCGHFYHMSCIQPWLQFRSPECPLCKEDVRNAYIDIPEPVTSQTVTTTISEKIIDWFQRRIFCCCSGRQATPTSPSNTLPPGSGGDMTEVRIVTPTTPSNNRTRDGTLHQVSLAHVET